MRFQIQQSWMFNPVYRLHISEAVIAVSTPIVGWGEQLNWTWRDGTEFRLVFPSGSPRLKDFEWRLFSGDNLVCSARIYSPPSQKVFRLMPAHRVRWNLGNQAVVCEPKGCCGRLGHSLRQKDGKMLAFWRPRRSVMPARRVWYDGVWRNGLPESVAAALFGMILAEIYPQDYSGAGGGGD